MDEFDGHHGKVVSLGGHRGATGPAAIAEVRAYWEALRGGRAAPYRSEVDPRGIERSLDRAFVLERIAPRVARFRLAGMHLNDLMGMEVRGMPFTTLFTPAARQDIGFLLESVFAGPCTADLTLAGEGGFGKPPLTGRMVLLPLRSDLGDVSRILGCLVADGAIGRAPRRFDLCESLARPVAATVPERGAARPPPAMGLAEPATPFAAAPERPARGRAHLRLVVSDE